MGLAERIPDDVVIEDNINIIDFQKLVEDKKKKQVKVIKYKKDGSIKIIPNNKIEGKASEVYPFRTKEEVSSIINVLDKHIDEATTIYNKKRWIRNKMLFVVGINLGIRGSDLCNLKWSDFFYENMTFKERTKIQPQKTKNKTKKYVTLFFNDTVKNIINEYIKQYPIDNLDDYVFVTTKGEHLDRDAMGRMIKGIAKEAGIKFNVNSHSLRKTFGYRTWTNANDKGEALSMLQYIFGHSSMKTTMRYIGVTQEQVDGIFQNINVDNWF